MTERNESDFPSAFFLEDLIASSSMFYGFMSCAMRDSKLENY